MRFTEAIKLFEKAGIDNAPYDAAQIFMHFGGFSRADLIGRDIDCDGVDLLRAINERCEHKPLQYIIGEVGFYRETYKVSPDCLIPRSDTEILVDYAVRHIPSGAHFADLCTGSGCVAISTLKNTSGTTATAVDLSGGALSIAEENAAKNQVSDRLSFVCADALRSAIDGEFFAVLSNPPYVTESAYKELAPEIYFEPKMAFVGGEDGLVFYERITELYKNKIAPHGFIGYEIGFDQGESLKEIAKKHGMSAEIVKDYSGNDRVCILRK